MQRELLWELIFIAFAFGFVWIKSLSRGIYLYKSLKQGIYLYKSLKQGIYADKFLINSY